MIDIPRAARGRHALSTVNEQSVLKNDIECAFPSTFVINQGYDLKRSLSLPVQQGYDYTITDEERRDDTMIAHSYELKRSTSLSLKKTKSPSPLEDVSKFQNDQLVPGHHVTASLKSSHKLNRQLSEALLSKSTGAYDEIESDTGKRRKFWRLLKREAMIVMNIYVDQSGSLSNLRNGLSIVLFLGILFGLSMPKNYDLPTPWYRLISSIIGYTYVCSWSICFYPQLITNMERKSVAGLSTDSSLFQLVNLLAYAIYCTSFYFNKGIQREYKEIHGENAQLLVESSDVVFSVHGTAMSAILLGQIFYYDGFQASPLSKAAKFVLSLVLLCCVIYILLIMTNTPGFLWIDFLYVLASIKLFLGIGSYSSQVLLNYRRKSTNGFNIWNIILDCTGGVLSLCQLMFDAADMNELRVGIVSNWAKLVVSLISLSFDGVLLFQHFILYSDRRTKNQQQKRQELRVFTMKNEDNLVV